MIQEKSRTIPPALNVSNEITRLGCVILSELLDGATWNSPLLMKAIIDLIEQRSGVVEETNDLRTMARGEQTRSGKTIPDPRSGTNGTIDTSVSAAERSRPILQPQNKNVVWVADGRDGHHRKRIVVRAGQADLTGEL
jgi:hypothetical protein